MRFMMMTTEDSSTASTPPSPELYVEMGKLIEEMTKAGVLLATGGLSPNPTWIKSAGGRVTVTDGPFTEAKEAVVGFALVEAKSREEAIEWLKRAPFREGEVEIRQVFEAEDFGAEFTPELREQEERLRQQIAAQK